MKHTLPWPCSQQTFTFDNCVQKRPLNNLCNGVPITTVQTLQGDVTVNQLVEHRTGIREVTRSNPVEALIFLRLLPSNCLNYKFTAMITLHLPLIDHRKGFGIRAQISLWKSTLFLINPLRTCMAFDFMDNN